jgi:sarcosine oxidase subunit beta
MNYDFAVIGAGVTGLSIAWHLTANEQRSVLVLDGGGVGSGATAVQRGGVRQQWGTRTSCRLAVECFNFYETFDARFKPRVAPSLSKGGYLFVAESDAGRLQLEANVKLQNEEGIASRLVDAEEAAALAPGMYSDGIAAAAWHDQDGYFDHPESIVASFYEAAVKQGLAFRQTDVRGLSRSGSNWALTLADGETVTAATVVVAAAYETPKLLGTLGIDVPITKEARYLFYSDPLQERLLEPLAIFVDRHFAAKQLADGTVLASDLTAEGDPITHRQEWYEHITSSIHDRLPMLDSLPFPKMVQGFYDVTPDHQPIVGPVPGHDDLWVAAGLNGRGLMMSPAIGRLVSEALSTDSLPDPLTELGFERFAVDQLDPEPQVV